MKLTIPHFDSTSDFVSWWSSPEIKELREKNPQAASKILEHERVKPWAEQVLHETLQPACTLDVFTLEEKQGIASRSTDKAVKELPPEAENGKPFGKRYKIICELGRGGMGIVYKAFDCELDRTVALKVLISEDTELNEAQIKIFAREARAAASLEHDNIVKVFDVGEIDGKHFFTMQFIEGVSLDKALHDKKKYGITQHKTLEILRDVADALHHAHTRKVIHRDVKPGNVMLDSNMRPYVTDFGLAKQTKISDRSISKTGQIMGTPYYMSPEQARGEVNKIDARSDVFSLGAMMFEAFSGTKPFTGTQLFEILDSVINKEAPSLRAVALNQRIPQDVETICMKCIEKEPPSRYQSAGEVAEEIGRFLNDEPITAKPTGLTTRIWKKARKNKVAAIAASAVVIIILCVATILIVSASQKSEKVAEYLQQAEQEFGKGNFAESRALCERALELSALNNTASDLREKCISAINRIDEKGRGEKEAAEKLAQDKIDKEKIRAQAQGILDRINATRTPEEKIKACEDALNIDPSFGLAWQEKGYALKDLGKFDEAFDSFSKAVELTPTLAYSYYERAIITQYFHSKPEDAIPDFEKVLELDPKSHIGYYAKGNIELHRKEYDAAIADYAKAIELYPQFFYAYASRGGARTNNGDLNGGIADYTKAIEINPQDSTTYAFRGDVYLQQGNIENAIKDCNKAIEINPREASNYFIRSHVRDKQGNIDGAIEDYTKVIEIDPHFTAAYLIHLNRGIAYAIKGNLDAAINDYNKAIEIKSNDAIVYAFRGLARSNKGDLDGAITDCGKAIEINPKYADAYFNRGNARFSKGKLDDAINDFTKAIEINPKYADAYNNRGYTRLMKDDLDAALEDYNKAIEINPKNTQAYINRAITYSTKDDANNAIKDLEKVLELSPNHPKSEFIRKTITDLKKKLGR
jgi:tetratricopeptide (TPR) repeat protein/predicted Ser/Thr protein kinase